MTDVTTYTCTTTGDLATVTDPLTLAETDSYDPLNRLTKTLDRGGFTTALAWDAQDRMTTYTDPRDLVTEFTYNGFGEVVSETSPDRSSITHVLDRRGLVTARTDGRGVTVGYSYDNGGRLTGIDYPTGGIGDVVFTWDQPYVGVPADANKGHIGRIDDGTIRMSFGHRVLAAGPEVATRSVYPANRTYNIRAPRKIALAAPLG